MRINKVVQSYMLRYSNPNWLNASSLASTRDFSPFLLSLCGSSSLRQESTRCSNPTSLRGQTIHANIASFYCAPCLVNSCVTRQLDYHFKTSQYLSVLCLATRTIFVCRIFCFHVFLFNYQFLNHVTKWHAQALVFFKLKSTTSLEGSLPGWPFVCPRSTNLTDLLVVIGYRGPGTRKIDK